MIEEVFSQGSSYFHRRDPRAKIVGTIFYTATVALLNSFIPLLLALAFSLMMLFLARLPWAAVSKRLLLVNGFTLFLWITLPLTYGGEQYYDYSFLHLSREGIILAAQITLKTNSIILAIIALLTTSTIAELGSGLDRLRFPKKICFLLLYSYRYIFVIHQEYSRLLRAARMRSFSPATNLHTYRTFAYLFGMTLVKSYNRAQRVHQAMLLRGFNGNLVSLHRYDFTLRDLFFLLLLCFSILLLIFMSFV
ncbi:MAG: cobalt ECF transporter T component CbiQ [Desulfocapsaceae bacterium]|nr:cobalt ECF transporter T component CbiQ [Desulfocapsaceae bacterium]